MNNREPMDEQDLRRLREALDAARDSIPDKVKPEAIVRLLEQEKAPARLPVHKRRWFKVAVPLAACTAAAAVIIPAAWHHQMPKPNYSGGVWADTTPQLDNGDCATGQERHSSSLDAAGESAPEAAPETATKGTAERQDDPNQSESELTGSLLSADSLQSLLSEGAVLVDLRDVAAYTAGHISQAKNLPLDRLEVEIKALAPEENTVILYGDTEESCAAAARKLTALGYREVINLGNFAVSWTYPTETLPPAIETPD